VRRRGLLIAAAVFAAVLALALPGGVIAKLTPSISGGTLTLTGTDGNDTVTIDIVPGVSDPTEPFLEITDPSGVDPLPQGCFRKNNNTIHCPVELITNFVIRFGDGDDTLNVGEDVLEFFDAFGEGGDDDLETGDGKDHLDGGPGKDKLNGDEGPDDREGGPGNDVLEASAGNDKQNGGGGNDKIYGGPGKDTQKGGPGGDTLIGGGGNDSQKGGGGRDRCVGGPGTETFTGCEIGYAY
jgi:Ca2+-binding RTX toxin-like protein